MTRRIVADLFVEDQAHEQFVAALVARLACELGRRAEIRIRCARGGHGHAISELQLYQRSVQSRLGSLETPDILIVAIDANCKDLNPARKEIHGMLTPLFRDSAAIACPDPHVERWYIADPESFRKVVGIAPSCKRKKCRRDYYKHILAQAVAKAGHTPTLGGIEFARELVLAMDLDRAAKSDRSLKLFLDELRSRLKAL